MSLNFTVAGDYVSGTPCMFGSVPASYGALSPLEHEEADGFAFVNAAVRPSSGRGRSSGTGRRRTSRPASWRASARWSFPTTCSRRSPTTGSPTRSGRRWRTCGPGRAASAAADLTAEQLYALVDLVARFAGRLPAEVAEAEMRRVDAAGAENLWFAWAGATERGERHYYRVQGPGLLIEHDNTQGGGNHVHSVWRVPGGDFGDDLLAAHYREEKHAKRPTEAVASRDAPPGLSPASARGGRWRRVRAGQAA